MIRILTKLRGRIKAGVDLGQQCAGSKGLNPKRVWVIGDKVNGHGISV